MAKITYTEWKREREKSLNELPLFFAFGQDQFDEMIKQMGFTKENYVDNIYRYAPNCFIRKTDSKLVHKHNAESTAELIELQKDEQFMYEAFLYELANHEFVITYDYDDTLDATGVTEKELLESPMLLRALKKAKVDYLKDMERFE